MRKIEICSLGIFSVHDHMQSPISFSYFKYLSVGHVDGSLCQTNKPFAVRILWVVSDLNTKLTKWKVGKRKLYLFQNLPDSYLNWFKWWIILLITYCLLTERSVDDIKWFLISYRSTQKREKHTRTNTRLYMLKLFL